MAPWRVPLLLHAEGRWVAAPGEGGLAEILGRGRKGWAGWEDSPVPVSLAFLGGDVCSSWVPRVTYKELTNL